jgi:hypothetical protein
VSEPVAMKTCTKCGKEFPATNEYFSRSSITEDGLRTWCKTCCRQYNQMRYNKNKEKIREQNKQWRNTNIEKVREQEMRYRESHREECAQRVKKWSDENTEYLQQYRELNKDRRASKQLQYRKNNPAKLRVLKLRYEARKENLPDNLTVQDWRRATDYFNGCCAVCGRQLKDLFGTHTAAADHWIPLSYQGKDNPGTVATNIVPLCHGEDGCNNRKHNKLPTVWLTERYGTRQANVILARIETYFQWVRSQDSEDVA